MTGHECTWVWPLVSWVPGWARVVPGFRPLYPGSLAGHECTWVSPLVSWVPGWARVHLGFAPCILGPWLGTSVPGFHPLYCILGPWLGTTVPGFCPLDPGSLAGHKCTWVSPTEYTELQPLLSGVHSVMRVKLVLAGEGGGCMPTPSHYNYHHQ